MNTSVGCKLKCSRNSFVNGLRIFNAAIYKRMAIPCLQLLEALGELEASNVGYYITKMLWYCICMQWFYQKKKVFFSESLTFPAILNYIAVLWETNKSFGMEKVKKEQWLSVPDSEPINNSNHTVQTVCSPCHYHRK